MSDIRFGPFNLDTSATRLLRDGAEVKLRPQALQALRVLLLHGGQTVRYEQMIAEAWHGTVVSRHTVDVTVGEVKKCLQEYGGWITNRPKVGYRLEVPKSEGLVRTGWHFWSRRTREGFDKAIEAFQQAAAECPSDFRAFEGLSASYLMLATFGMRPPREMYPQFLAAYDRARELGVETTELRCNHAHGLHVFERRFSEAEAEFLETLREAPAAASTWVRLARLYACLGRTDEALDALGRGRRADPLLPTVLAMEVLIRIWRREFDAAAAVGMKAVELHPYLQIARATYGQALEYLGRLDEALVQYQAASMMSPDLSWIRVHEGICLAKQQRLPEALAILDELEQRRQFEYVDACFMAWFRAALGQRDEAFRELERAVTENSSWLHSLDVDLTMDYFRGDPRFARVREEVLGHNAPAAPSAVN
jgi:DNA-binding winged helix-turn-helix (wHTH) protein/tetratricopeptide (TPR) repeat protein